MARRLPLALLLLVVLLVFTPSPGTAVSSGCAAQTFSKNRTYALCSNLPVLGATLHWTLDSTTSALHLAFSAPPAHPAGWVAWGINPSTPTMIGTQALLAFRAAGGSMDVATYNISSRLGVAKSKIAYEVADLAAESGSDGKITIFATVSLPAGTKKVIHVWQVGPSVTKGAPDQHALEPDNMASGANLDLVAGGDASSNTTSAGGNNTSAGASGSSASAAVGSRLPRGNAITAWLIPSFSWSFLVVLGFWGHFGF